MDQASMKLSEVSKLSYGTYKHGQCFLNDCIYVIGGVTKDGCANVAQSFNVHSKQCKVLAPFRYPTKQSLCTAYNDKYIFKFWGLLGNEQRCSRIERYDAGANFWSEIANPQST